MGLCNLVKKHTATAIDAACQKALKAGARWLKDIQRLIVEPSEQGNFVFAQNHPLIRDLKTYSDFVHDHHPPNYDQQHPQTICSHPAPLRTA